MERPIFEKANEALRVISSDPSPQQMIEDRLKAMVNFGTAMDAAREEGIEIGRALSSEKRREEGIQRHIVEGVKIGINYNRRETVLNMGTEGMKADQIARILKLDLVLVEEILWKGASR